ncbi:MAG: hypothetical protein ACRCXZ_04625 [Patescibacteria group bacterium]
MDISMIVLKFVRKFNLEDKFHDWQFSLIEKMEKKERRILKVTYYFMGRNLLYLLRSETFGESILDAQDDDKEFFIIAQGDVMAMMRVENLLETIKYIEGWDTNSILDSALHRICRRYKQERSDEMKKRFQFIKDIFI